MRMVLIFCMIILQLMCVRVCRVLAKAPTTPKILFTSTRDGNREVYMMNPDGSEQVNLTQHRATDLGAVWSPTGEQILVSDRQDACAGVFDGDGGNVRRVSSATWSPDRKQFDACKFGLGPVFDGCGWFRNVRRVFKRKITAWGLRRECLWQTFCLHLHGQDPEQRLAPNASGKADWSPDGSM